MSEGNIEIVEFVEGTEPNEFFNGRQKFQHSLFISPRAKVVNKNYFLSHSIRKNE